MRILCADGQACVRVEIYHLVVGDCWERTEKQHAAPNNPLNMQYSTNTT